MTRGDPRHGRTRKQAGLRNRQSAHENTPHEELAKLPISALQGLTDKHAAQLEEALNIKTIGELGTNKYFLWAQAISKLAE